MTVHVFPMACPHCSQGGVTGAPVLRDSFDSCSRCGFRIEAITLAVPTAECPRCHALVPDHDGFGVLAHMKPAYPDGCGYCSHPSYTDGVCGICGEGAMRARNGGCAVAHERCVGLDADEFVIVVVTSDREMHFCARHALAAEALHTYAGAAGEDVAELLSRLEHNR